MQRFAISLALLALATSPALASGGGAHKKPAHGAEKKKEKTGGHGAPKKDAKKGGHGAAAKGGHGAAKGHGAKASEKPAVKDEASMHVADVEKMLAIIAGKEKRHDPKLYTEVDLGEFKVTRQGRDDDEIFVLKFHLYGVLSEHDQEKFSLSSAGREQRLRDAVLSVVHRAEYNQVVDPALDVVKSNLVAALNRVLQNDFLRDVAFSTFSMERS